MPAEDSSREKMRSAAAVVAAVAEAEEEDDDDDDDDDDDNDDEAELAASAASKARCCLGYSTKGDSAVICRCCCCCCFFSWRQLRRSAVRSRLQEREQLPALTGRSTAAAAGSPAASRGRFRPATRFIPAPASPVLANTLCATRHSNLFKLLLWYSSLPYCISIACILYCTVPGTVCILYIPYCLYPGTVQLQYRLLFRSMSKNSA